MEPDALSGAERLPRQDISVTTPEFLSVLGVVHRSDKFDPSIIRDETSLSNDQIEAVTEELQSRGLLTKTVNGEIPSKVVHEKVGSGTSPEEIRLRKLARLPLSLHFVIPRLLAVQSETRAASHAANRAAFINDKVWQESRKWNLTIEEPRVPAPTPGIVTDKVGNPIDISSMLIPRARRSPVNRATRQDSEPRGSEVTEAELEMRLSRIAEFVRTAGPKENRLAEIAMSKGGLSLLTMIDTLSDRRHSATRVQAMEMAELLKSYFIIQDTTEAGIYAVTITPEELDKATIQAFNEDQYEDNSPVSGSPSRPHEDYNKPPHQRGVARMADRPESTAHQDTTYEATTSAIEHGTPRPRAKDEAEASPVNARYTPTKPGAKEVAEQLVAPENSPFKTDLSHAELRDIKRYVSFRLDEAMQFYTDEKREKTGDPDAELTDEERAAYARETVNDALEKQLHAHYDIDEDDANTINQGIEQLRKDIDTVTEIDRAEHEKTYREFYDRVEQIVAQDVAADTSDNARGKKYAMARTKRWGEAIDMLPESQREEALNHFRQFKQSDNEARAARRADRDASTTQKSDKASGRPETPQQRRARENREKMGLAKYDQILES